LKKKKTKSPFLKVSEPYTPHITSYVSVREKYNIDPLNYGFPALNGLESGSWVRGMESGSRVKVVVIALALAVAVGVRVTIVIVVLIVRDILSSALKL
jgi:hypothetical protein